MAELPQGGALQEEMPFAIVQGVPLSEVPKDLYIPPDALEVFLEAFSGPLDLLLYLIKRQNLDILNIPIARVTEQYMTYIELMEVLQLELAGEYLVMAAMLAEIKSRMLLPRPEQDEDEEDPRAELVRRLQEYEIFKQAAQVIDDLPRLGRDCFAALIDFPDKRVHTKPPEVSLDTILQSFGEVLRRAEVYSHHHIQREPLSVRERMVSILDRVNATSLPGSVTCSSWKKAGQALSWCFWRCWNWPGKPLLKSCRMKPMVRSISRQSHEPC